MKVLYDDPLPTKLRRIAIVVSGGRAEIEAALNELENKYKSDYEKLMIRVYPSEEAQSYNGWTAMATWRAGRGFLIDWDNDPGLRKALHESLDGPDD